MADYFEPRHRKETQSPIAWAITVVALGWGVWWMADANQYRADVEALQQDLLQARQDISVARDDIDQCRADMEAINDQ